VRFTRKDERRKIGGVTGDCLGAANQLVELASYLAQLNFG